MDVNKMDFEEKRKKLVESLKRKGILESEQVIDAMLKVPREKFLPENSRASAYVDSPLSIGKGQTISAPHMNAMMCEKLNLKEGEKVLEVGTGSGYHAALCAEIVAPSGHVYSIERHKKLAKQARENLEQAGYKDFVTVIVGDGTKGYEEKAPYDKVLVTAASPKEVPQPLKDQLAEGGIICIPVGSKNFGQKLILVKRIGDQFETEKITSVRFVKLIGLYGYDK
jgi:protein-L-isoaspartate(D-aspartate) O-methyltransferase